MLVVSLVREQKMRKGKTDNLVEIGSRRQFTPLTTCSVGDGAGFGRAPLPDHLRHTALVLMSPPRSSPFRYRSGLSSIRQLPPG